MELVHPILDKLEYMHLNREIDNWSLNFGKLTKLVIDDNGIVAHFFVKKNEAPFLIEDRKTLIVLLDENKNPIVSETIDFLDKQVSCGKFGVTYV